MIADRKPYPAMKDSGVEWFGQMPRGWVSQPALAMCRPQQAKNNRGVRAATLLCYEAPPT